MATIIDVAQQAGVSVKTVSRVLNNESNVREKTAERVRAAMKALDYTPSTAARELRSGRSRSIGMLFSDPSSGFQARLHHAALTACSDAGYFLAAGIFDETAENWRRQLAEFLARTRVDNMVLVPPLCDSDDLLQELVDHEVATVLISPSHAPEGAHVVRMDDYGAAREITDHLLALGHTRLGHLTGPKGHVASADRERGFLDAIRADGRAQVREDWIRPGLFRFKEAVAAAESMLGGVDRPTAIFAANDETAAAVCFAAGRMGLRVPDDLSVAGFDDAPIATTVWPPLTTIAQPFDAMAEAMVTLIGETPLQGEARWCGKTLTLPHALRPRASTSAPAS
ncbi:MAG: LacI family DNA-binding transcriptional regulator [Alphaproteobacteria bacterium]|nr:LacI family DNA-binding transcriptional regulator [Alphaproteobacteria bacterium]